MEKNDKWWLSNPDAIRAGVGVVLHWKPTGWVVHRVIDGSPAAISGIKSGDRLHSINGHELAALESIRKSFSMPAMQSNESWTYRVIRNEGEHTAIVKPETLRSLIEQESVSPKHEYCYTCYECEMTTDGWAQCGNDGCSLACIIT